MPMLKNQEFEFGPAEGSAPLDVPLDEQGRSLRELEQDGSNVTASSPAGFSWGDRVRETAQQVQQTAPVESKSVRPEPTDLLGGSLTSLAKLISNVTEAYTCAIFLVDQKTQSLTIAGAHTLSREFRWDSRIPLGAGLVGWTAQNGTRVSVSPFENDATTLLYYSTEQSLKSFFAVPIFGTNRKVLGVIACDSKKNYAFAKMIEKIVQDFSVQATILLTLCGRIQHFEAQPDVQTDVLRDALERLRGFEDEKSLLNAAAEVPADLVHRDALVLMTLAEGGVGPGAFYTAPGQSRVSHRLFDLVCRHKLLLSGERSVHALPTDDIKQRSFLSVPFHCLGKEAGSFNLLSRPGEAFVDVQIQTIERFAQVVGRELERIRLHERFVSMTETNGIQSWKQFSVAARGILRDARSKRQPMTVIRLCLRNLREIEDLIGLDGTVVVMQRVMRLVEQVVRQPAAMCYLYGFQIIVLTGAGDGERTITRLKNLIERFTPADLMVNAPQVKIGRVILDGLSVVTAAFPTEGETLEQLVARTTRLLETDQMKQPMERVANAGTWS